MSDGGPQDIISVSSAQADPVSSEKQLRVFLVVADDTTELTTALRYACLRASKTGGRVAILYVIEPADFQHWMSVETLMQSERRNEAERVLQKMAAKVLEWSDHMPCFYICEGKRTEQLLNVLEEDNVSILVLGADPGPKGPGPLVSALSGKLIGKMKVPLTVVPGNLPDEALDELT